MALNPFRVPLQCTANERCRLPHGYMGADGTLQITSRHSGSKHEYTVTVAQLLADFIRYNLVSDDMLEDIAGQVARAIDE